MAAAGFAANVDPIPQSRQPITRSHDRLRTRWSTSPTVTGNARMRFCCDAPTASRSPLHPTGMRSRPQLRDTVDSDAVRLDVIPDDLRPQLAEASQLTESLRLYDSPYHAELDWWTAAFEVSDGIPHSSLVSAAESDRVDVGRTFPVTNHRERRLEVGDDRSKVLVLSTYDDTRESVLRCGEVTVRRTARRDDGRARHLHADPHHRGRCEPNDCRWIDRSGRSGHHTPGPRPRRPDAVDR